MSSEKSLTPQIRFKGFTEAWEQRKLGDIAAFSKGQGFSKSNLTDSGSPVILYGRLYTNYETQICKVDTFVKSSSCGVLSKGGEVIVPASGETAEDIAVASHVSLPGILLGGDLNVVTPKYNLDSNFLALFITFGNAHVELSKRAQGKSVVHVRNGDLSQLNIKYPTQSEQVLISNLFIKNDNLITLHQRKLDALKKIKSALLEKMFPKDGSNIPEIRFTGFTEAWEQRKLGETFCITMGQSPSSANYTSNPDDYVLVQGNADLQNGWVYPRVWTTQVTKSAEPGTLIMSVRAPVGAMGKTAYKIVLGRGVAGIQGPEILFQLFKKYESEGYWIKKSTGSTFDSINGDELKNTLVTLPNISPEQTDIENLLIRLDSLITLHQRKLDALKKIKSALLEKMFV